MQDEQKGAHVYRHNSSVNPPKELKRARSYGFDKSKRLVSSYQYTEVLRKGQTQRNPLFIMVSLPNNRTTARLGITVSKKVSKRAVERNRLKRLVRETFRHCQQELQNNDFVIIARIKAREADNQTVRKTLDNMWAKATD